MTVHPSVRDIVPIKFERTLAGRNFTSGAFTEGLSVNQCDNLKIVNFSCILRPKNILSVIKHKEFEFREGNWNTKKL